MDDIIFSIPLLIIALIIVVAVSLIDVTAIIYALHASYNNEKITVPEMFVTGISSISRLKKPYNWGIMGFLLILVPLVSSIASSEFISNIQIPGFIKDYISANTFLNFAFIVVFTLLWVLAFLWLLSVHIFEIEATTYSTACKKSFKLVKKHFVRTFISFAIWKLLIILIKAVIICVGIAGASFIISKTVALGNQLYVAFIISMVIIAIVNYLTQLVIVPINFAYLSALYYTYSENEATEKLPFVHAKVPFQNFKYPWCIAAAALSVVLVAGLALDVTNDALGYILPSSYTTQEVAAHRGSSANYPENTMPAYEQAVIEGCQWIELDVHQTKDGVVVVSHDDTLKRIGGVNVAIYDLTYEELLQYDVGSWFS